MDWVAASFGTNSTLSSVWSRCVRGTLSEYSMHQTISILVYVDLYLYWNRVFAWNVFLPSLSVMPSLILRISEAASDQASTWGKVGWFKEWKPANELWWNKILFQPRRSSIEWWFQWGRSYCTTLRRWWSTFILIVSAVCNLCIVITSFHWSWPLHFLHARQAGGALHVQRGLRGCTGRHQDHLHQHSFLARSHQLPGKYPQPDIWNYLQWLRWSFWGSSLWSSWATLCWF